MIILKVYSIIILSLMIVGLLINTNSKDNSFRISAVILFPILLYTILS